MKRYITTYILLPLILGISVISCIEEMEVAQPMQGNDTMTALVPRVTSFANQYVTKAVNYDTGEKDINSLFVLVFDKNGNLKYKEYQSGLGDKKSIELNRSMLNLSNATVIMIANVEPANIKKTNAESLADAETLTLNGLKEYSITFTEDQDVVITSLGDGFNGFQMVGGDDGVDLTKDAHDNAIEVNLKILFAKVKFEIGVAPGTENDGTGEFTMNGYSVHNVSKSTALAIPTTDEEGQEVRVFDFLETEPLTSDYATESTAYTSTAISGSGTKAENGTHTFTFYIAESRYNHNVSDFTGIYPDSWAATSNEDDVKNWKNLTDDQKKLEENQPDGISYFYDDLLQQYKPKLAEVEDGSPGKALATYVMVNGTYKDYRGTLWNVKYKVYLGKDNSRNFHVDRNSQYTNILTIKGIRNNDSYGEDQVWIDHRVNVSYNGSGAEDHVTITRQTLLDAHIEVRPLRVKWTGDDYDGVRIYLPTDSNGNLIDWIGIERYTGNNNREASVYCYAVDKSSGESFPTGKRKYFTTSLIEELQTKEGEFGVRTDNGKKYIYLLNGECAWIYFDENTGAGDREAEINLDFYTKSGSTQPVVYKINQRGLQTVGGYAIESYEEYLHTYDSDDKYNLSTSPVDYTQQGLAWGFTDHKLSQNTLVNTTVIPTTALKNQAIKQYAYDYFHELDDPNSRYDYKYTKASGSWTDASFGTGLTFTDVASANRYITIKDMGTMPENAYQYCLSKNKFEADDFGNVSMTINWYLPDPYEMQTILNAGQSGNTPVDLDSDAYYWSSQPSFSTAGTYINESTDNARAVSMQEGITDRSRDNQHRIRCVYANKGIDLDEEAMEDRVPDGVGGNYVVYMKAWNNGGYGYFNYLLPPAKPRESSTDWKYNDDRGTAYPNKDNVSSISGEKFSYIKTSDKDGNPIEGFNINPGETSSWTEYDPVMGSPDGYYTTLATYPGLTDFTLTKRAIGEAYKPSTTKKSATQTVRKETIIALDKTLPPASDLRTLDHLSNGSMLNISFDQSKGTTQPAFLYDELVSGTSSVNTHNWIKPTYSVINHPMTPEEKTLSARGSDSAEGTSTRFGSADLARQYAFEGNASNLWNGAYEKAKQVALNNLKDEIETNYSGWTFNETDVEYTDLNYKSTTVKWDDETYAVKYQESSSWSGYTCTCTVTLYATVTIRKSAILPLYSQDDGTGVWGAPVATPTTLTPTINTDEMRMYCGNSFTISLSEAAKQQGYEITKVKVHYLGGNLVDEYGTANADKAYARFVDSEITLPTESKTVKVIGSTETLHLAGMDYNENQNDGTGTHEWSGSGRESVTLVLADYLVATNLNGLNLVYVYQYTNTPRQPEKHIIVDKIEVKCTKKKNATFDFKQIYIDSGSLETSGCTVKHITFTAEGGTVEAPAAIKADGLKLYSGSKVTFKALDGYVINNITGDPDLTFTGSQQTVEFSDLPEKTISDKIIVLYSKDDNDQTL